MMRLLIITVLFISCNNFQQKQTTLTDNSLSVETKIDYKVNSYKLFLGQTKDSVRNTLDIRRNFEAGRGTNPGDSTEYFMNTSDELIRITRPETTAVLPALYFTFRKGKLAEFESPVIFEPNVKDQKTIYNILILLEPYYDKLKSDSNKIKLSQQLSLKFNYSNCEECFSIDTVGQNDLVFNYKIKTR